ncbi:Cobalamin biosynthesis protein CobD [Bradyrhizobium vignae]|uniref:Cobalamin biosynthesis protein CobD n=2 Tax=Bradyrhizobium vignae TaxID=1549949 RepID=A0A2U3Q507_9BRAD|nr:Cobalamin biosynthesis protein CobD [Bradyrhizobium vignae]
MRSALALRNRGGQEAGVGFAGAMVVAMAVDALLGWPAPLFARIGHPVTWLGRLIAAIDAAWNRASDPPAWRRAAGVAGALVVIALSVALGWIVQSVLSLGWIQIMLIGILAWPLVALRSLHDHVAAVAMPLQAGDIAAAREAVSRIVGRDPTALDEAGIARAAIESLAENSSDGIVAPVFWGALFGLPGIFGYKAINTLDSMIGHRSERHEAFGWAAARIDDLANFIPARLTGFLFVLLASRRSEALSCMARDARRHRSPNAGWPEAAMAGALGVRLSGPRIYHGSATDEPWLNQGARDPRAADITEALTVYRRAMMLLAALLAILAFA